ncbi:uncharacterized protein Tco025E_07604 [Trypanosoma conorhini]|uniref:Uncharacterized protein n=1 Tax=Trypanosoma conorhini TaxID=83891 RepID=A0A3R7LZG0_9TRYP|nr:uncharacterized protein Tco025E_07604 [Trypanosoma conorhini]RNF06289.1 hypothetical protein Tco025E_07604 [Trypanosoma conorhini]
MEPLARHNSPAMDANGCRNPHGSSRVNAAGNEEVAVRTRRGGRRAQRRATQQQVAPPATATAAAGTTSKAMGTVVVPVRGEAATSSGNQRPVKCTAVRRRAKPANTTVTRVATGVSLEALRAKRNGTAADGAPGGDARTIEAVSRILLMYASRQAHGGKANFNRRPGSFPSEADACKVGLERGGDGVEGAEGSTLATAPGAAEKNVGVFLGDLPPSGADVAGTRDIHAYVMSLVSSGDLPPESLEVLHAMLSHTTRGGRVDAFAAPRRGRHGIPQPGFPPTRKDAQQPTTHAFSTNFDCPAQQQQQHELIEPTEEDLFGYGSYASCKYPAYTHGMDCAQVDVAPLHYPAGQPSLTADGAYLGEKAASYPFLGEYAPREDQAQQLSTHAGALDGVAGYEDYAHLLGTSGRCEVNTSKREATRKSNYGNDDDDDDDADFKAMLQDIRDLAQQASSPPRLGDANSAGATAAAGSWNGCSGDYPDEALLLLFLFLVACAVRHDQPDGA